MKNAAMRFAGCTWLYNPQSVSVADKRNISENKLHSSDSIIQNFGRIARVVSGEGFLFGDDCTVQMERLWRLYRQKAEGCLTIPQIVSMRAVFSQLTLTAEPKDKLIKYRFGFTEVMREEKMKTPKDVHTVVYGESLWDISYSSGLSVEKLLSLNPEIRHPFELNTGAQVRLC